MKIVMDMERGSREIGGGGKSIDPKTMDYVKAYKNTLREGVQEIASPDQVNGVNVNNFSLEEVNLMLKSPEMYEGKDIPNESDLVEIKKILSARKVLEQ